MDWFSWLSRSNLEPSLTYSYGLCFTRNELQKDDLVYFDHEFLQSLGINVAKHRLEILKLARKDVESRTTTNGISKLVWAFKKTRKIITKNIISKLGFINKNPIQDLYEIPPQNQWSGGALKRFSSSSALMKSGPLDTRGKLLQEKMMLKSMSGPLDVGALNLSPVRGGPIDGKWRERSSLVVGNRSPTIYGPPWEGRRSLSPMPNYHYYGGNLGVHDDEAHSLWSLMFQDLKPT